ncbi:hypothetical protein Y032_0054g2465 [Ancylostoma ceylanicum]|uniref:Uncharacterized protein n=1 Tax=Ancylostoma ceylanicum TaxID=53326 RepID=A0A016U644_9BILA|nr:hypothetical protein Y032_0054g2465 [Ancylostoma ceylanicum]
MFPNEHSLSEEHALSGLPQLSKLINALLEKKIKRVGEREAAKRDIATIVSNCLPFYISGSDSQVLPLKQLVKDLCLLALIEVDENGEKLNKNASSWKTGSLELTINVLSRLCDKELLYEDYIDFLRFSVNLVESPFVQSQTWVEDDITNVLAKFVTSCTCLIASDPLKELWSLVWRRLPIAMDTGGRSCGNYLRIARSILKHVNDTTLVSGDGGQKLVANMLETFLSAAKRKGFCKLSGQIEYVFELLSLVIDNWGIECREVILQHCLPFASTFVEKLNFSSAAINDLDSAWTFFDRLFHLAVPDSRPSCLVPNEAYLLAQSAGEVLRSALCSMSFNRVDYELKKGYIPLFARLLIIVDSAPSNSQENMDITIDVYTQHAKRRKKQYMLDMVTDWNFADGIDYNDRPHFVVSCLLLGYEITSRWSHRIDHHRLTSIATKLWDARSLIKFDWQLPAYCQLLNNLLKLGALDQQFGSDSENGSQTAKCLWKFALSSAHVGCSFDASCLLMKSILQRFRNAVGEDEDLTEAVFDVLSRSAAPHGPILYELVLCVLTELEYDELKPFPGASDRKSGDDQWRFRCQIAEWLITHIGSESSAWEALYVLCYLHPKRVSNSPPPADSKTGIERDLELFGLSETSAPLETNDSKVPLVAIPEIVHYITEIFEELWLNHDSSSATRISLWCSYLMFRSSVNVPFEMRCTNLVATMERWMYEVIGDAGPDLLSLINLHNVHPQLISSNLLLLLSSRLHDCPALAAHLVTRPVQLSISAAIIKNVMRGIGKYLSVNDSLDVRKAAGILLENFTAEVDTVSDLLLLLDESGDIIDKDSRQHLVSKIWQIIDEDIAEGEYDVDEAEIYRRRLSKCILRFSEPGDCKSVDLDCIDVTSIIRYLKSLSCSLLDWELISSLLERAGSNVILILKLVRDVLSDSTLFNLHSLVLGAVAKRDDVLQVCEQLIPDFALLLDCHYNSIMLHQPSPIRIPYINVILPLRNDKLVASFREPNMKMLGAEHFTAAFLLRMDGWHQKFFVGSFFKQLLIEPHTLLMNFWKAGRISIKRNCHLQLLRNIRTLFGAGLLSTVNSNMARGFLLTLFSVVSTILHFVAESNPSMVGSILQLITQLGCFSSDELIYLKCSLDNATFTEHEGAREFFNSAAEEFFCNGTVKDVRVFHCPEFWKCMRSALKAKKDHLIEDTTKNDILSTLLLIWDILPSLRCYIAPILSSFGDSNIVPSRKLECHYAICNIRDYCQIVLSDHRLESADVFVGCLRILSCEAFQDQAILRPSVVDHNAHETTDLISQWIISLYRDLVPEADENSTDFSANSMDEVVIDECDPICAVDSAITVFRVISRYACCVPKLCQIVAPYVLAVDDSGAETAIQLVLQYASIVVSSNIDSNLESARTRMARCLAESVDGIGLRRLSRVKLDYQFYFDGMCALIKCCLLSDLPNYAFAVANVLYDVIMSHQGERHLATFNGAKVNNAQFVELLKMIYIRIGSITGLKTLPTEVQNDDKVRVLFARTRFDWLDIISNPKASLQDLIDAYSYCGINYSGTRRELKYALAICAGKGSIISYPKRLISHEERLFAFLYSSSSLVCNELLAYLESMECEAAAKSELPNLTNISHLRDFAVVDLKGCFAIGDLKSLATSRLILFTTYLSRISDLGDIGRLYHFDLSIAISELSRRLIDLKAFASVIKQLDAVSDLSGFGPIPSRLLQTQNVNPPSFYEISDLPRLTGQRSDVQGPDPK